MPRGTLTRERIIQASLRLMDRFGLEAVTVRAVAAELGASPMALYAHFDSKDGLHGAMRAVLVEQIFRGAAGSTWQELLVTLTRRILRTLRNHPNWFSLVVRPAGPERSVVDVLERHVALTSREGFTVEQAVDSYLAATSLALGLAVVERTTRQNAGLRARGLQSPEVRKLDRIASGLVGGRADAVLDVGVRALAGALRGGRRQPRAKRRGRRVR